MLHARPLHRLFRARDGAALVEFALALPLLLTLMMGMLCYGQYIWIAHGAQQIANDAARAAMGGLTPAERETIARAVLSRTLPALPEIKPDRASLRIEERDGYLITHVLVDARDVTLMHTSFVPVPDPVIVRAAMVRLGGTE